MHLDVSIILLTIIIIASHNYRSGCSSQLATTPAFSICSSFITGVHPHILPVSYE